MDECCGGSEAGCMCSPAQLGMPMIGQHVPNFKFRIYHNDADKKVAMKDYAGKWVILFFYPADFTFVCPTELGDMAALYAEFQKLNAEVISFSTDTVFTHKAWHDTSDTIKNIKFPMGADPDGVIASALGTYITEGDDAGLSLRASFIIDPDGVIQAYEIHSNNIGRSAREFLRKLQAAIFVREHGGEVCPANWKPGEDTLKPGMDLVGKI